MGLLFLWILISAAALAVDIITSNILFVSFTIGGIFAIIANSMQLSDSLQILIFISVSVVSLAVIYPLITKKLKKTVTKTPLMEQTYIGRKIQIEDDILDKGKVKVDGIYWTVKNESEALSKGDIVVITSIDGNKLVIKKASSITN